jgi:elongation factor G
MNQGFPTSSLHANPATVRLTANPSRLPRPTRRAPLIAQVVRTTTDPFAGRLSMVRVFAGTLRSDDTVHVSGHRSFFVGTDDAVRPDHDDEERIGQIQYAAGTS